MKKEVQVINTRGWAREEWLSERRKSLGGSDIGAALGLCRWRSPYAVWAEKMGLTGEEEDNEAMRLGRDLEAYVAARFTERTGLRVRRVNAILRNAAYPHLHANIDREVVGSGVPCGLECKTASALSVKRFLGGEFPAEYYAQCVTYLAVTGYTRWYLAVLVLGKEFKVYQITRQKDDVTPAWCAGSVWVDQEELDSLRAFAATFWRHVEEGTPPPVDGSESTADTIEEIFPQSSEEGTEIDLNAVSDHLLRLTELKRQKKSLETQITAEENAVKAFMEDAPSGSYAAGNTLTTVSWRTQERRTFDGAAFVRDNPETDLTPYYKTSKCRPFKVTVTVKEK